MPIQYDSLDHTEKWRTPDKRRKENGKSGEFKYFSKEYPYYR